MKLAMNEKYFAIAVEDYFLSILGSHNENGACLGHYSSGG